MKKIMIIFGLFIILAALISGCVVQRGTIREDNIVTTQDVKTCLKQPYNQAWEKTTSEEIIVKFDDKHIDEIINLAREFDISNLEIHYTSDNTIFMKLNIQNNLPIEKICNFLNSKEITAHYPLPSYSVSKI